MAFPQNSYFPVTATHAMGMSFGPSKVLLTAVKMDLFSQLEEQPMTMREVAGKLNLTVHENSHGLRDFLDLLVSLKFLEKEGEGMKTRYRDTPEARKHLSKKSEYYLGGFLEFCHDRIYRYYGDLEECLRTGKPAGDAKTGGKSVWEEMEKDPRKLEQFAYAMHGISRYNFESFLKKYKGMENRKTIVDVGGCTGQLAMMIAKCMPHVNKVISFDRPAMTAIAKKAVMKEPTMKDKIELMSGDFVMDPLPKGDVIIMSMILHDWDLDMKKKLIKKAFDALPANGQFVVIENHLDDRRCENTVGLFVSLTMTLEFGDGKGFDFTHMEFDGWAKEAGFHSTEVMRLEGPSTALIAMKK